MNLNRHKHKTLKLLSVSKILFNSETIQTNFKFGLSFEELQSKLKCNTREAELIYSSLHSNKEIEYTNVDFEGLNLTQKGLTAFSEKKYLIKNNKIMVNWAKNFVQIFVPVFSLLIAFLALTIKINNLNSETTKELTTIKQKIELLQNSINKSELQTQNTPIN